MSISIKKIAIINTLSSFNTPSPREALDLALIFAAFDQQVSVIYLADGVYQLPQQQQPERIGTKDYLATKKAYGLYDIEQVVACTEDLVLRGISPEQLGIEVQLLPQAQLNQLLSGFDHVVTL